MEYVLSACTLLLFCSQSQDPHLEILSDAASDFLWQSRPHLSVFRCQILPRHPGSEHRFLRFFENFGSVRCRPPSSGRFRDIPHFLPAAGSSAAVSGTFLPEDPTEPEDAPQNASFQCADTARSSYILPETESSLQIPVHSYFPAKIRQNRRPPVLPLSDASGRAL